MRTPNGGGEPGRVGRERTPPRSQTVSHPTPAPTATIALHAKMASHQIAGSMVGVYRAAEARATGPSGYASRQPKLPRAQYPKNTPAWVLRVADAARYVRSARAVCF